MPQEASTTPTAWPDQGGLGELKLNWGFWYSFCHKQERENKTKTTQQQQKQTKNKGCSQNAKQKMCVIQNFKSQGVAREPQSKFSRVESDGGDFSQRVVGRIFKSFSLTVGRYCILSIQELSLKELSGTSPFSSCLSVSQDPAGGPGCLPDPPWEFSGGRGASLEVSTNKRQLYRFLWHLYFESNLK